MKNIDRLIRKKELCEILDVSEATLWRLEKRGELPRRRKISERRVGWLSSEIEQFISELDLAEQRID